MRTHGGIYFIFVLTLLVSYTAFKTSQVAHTKKAASFAIAVAVFALMIGWQFIYRSRRFSREELFFVVLAWVGSVILSAWATYVIFSLPIDLGTGLFLAARRLFGEPALDLHRREILTRFVPIGILGISGLAAAAGFKTAVEGPKIKRIDIPVPNLDNGLDGLTIAQISDLHVSPLVGRDYVDNVVNQTMNLDADLIVVTGDLADGSPQELESSIEPLKKLKARLGVFYVTGNHEYYWNAESWIQTTRDLGFVPLLNENKVIQHGGAEFVLGGVTDTSSENFPPYQKSDPLLAMGAAPRHSLRLLLAHRPESWKDATKAGWNVQLSGHTHAGQFFPFSLLMPLAHKYYRGLQRPSDLSLYVNVGTGYWGPPNRFTIPSEITLLTIKKGAPV